MRKALHPCSMTFIGLHFNNGDKRKDFQPSTKQQTVIGKEKYPNHNFPDRGSNPVRRIQSPALYHVAIKAGFYRKAVEVYHVPNCYIPPSYNETFVCIHANTNVTKLQVTTQHLLRPSGSKAATPTLATKCNRKGEKNPNHIFPNRGSNPVRRIQSPALYHVAIKAGFYRKAVEVYHIPNCYKTTSLQSLSQNISNLPLAAQEHMT